MTLEEVRRILQADVLVGTDLDSIHVRMACGADLMSDVLAYGKPETLLLTGLTNPQVIRTCEMVDLVAVCFVRGKRPPEATVELARASNLPLLATDLPLFESCGRLYQEGLKGCSEIEREDRAAQ